MPGITGSAFHGTLVVNTITTVTIAAGDLGVFVTNRADSPAFEMWVKVDGNAPGVGADGSFLVQGCRQFSATGSTVVKMISAYPIQYSVETF